MRPPGERLLIWFFGPVYILGIAATLLDPNRWYEHSVGLPLRQLWVPLDILLAVPLYGFFCPIPAFLGAFAFNIESGKFPRLRVSCSFLFISAMYLLGNSLRFRGSQWWWLHVYMIAQLITSGIMIHKIKKFNWIAFGAFILAAELRRRQFWMFCDYIWSLYFLFAMFTPWMYGVENTWLKS